MDSVLLCCCVFVSVGVMLRLVLLQATTVNVLMFPFFFFHFLHFNPSLSVCTLLSFMEIFALCFAIRSWLILNKQPEKCCCHHFSARRGKKMQLHFSSCWSLDLHPPEQVSLPPSRWRKNRHIFLSDICRASHIGVGNTVTVQMNLFGFDIFLGSYPAQIHFSL